MQYCYRLLSCGAALAALGSLPFAHAKEPFLKGSPMLDCSGLPCVDVTVDSGKTVRMMVDTANLRSILDRATAAKLGLTLTPYVGRDGKVHPEFAAATLKDVKIGAATLGDVPVMVVNLAPMVAKGLVPAAEGLLTYVPFAARVLRLDYKHHRVEVSAAQGQAMPCPGACGTITTPTFGRKGPPMVVTTGFSVNGKPVSAQIDTLYSGSMLIYPDSVAKLGLGAAQASPARRMFPFTDGGVEMIEGRAAEEGFGGTTLARNAPLYFATPDVHTPDGMFDGTVGHGLLDGHVVTFDFVAKHFWVS